MTTYYISGPMSGIPEHNFPRFHAVADALWERNDGDMDVLNPACNFDGDTTHDRAEYMILDLHHTLSADVIVLLPGWEKSEGAKLEIAVAKATGKRFVLAVEADKGWIFVNLKGAPSENPSPRGSVLDEAKSLVTGDRNNQYGPPTKDFQRSAEALNAYGYSGPGGRDLVPHDVAVMVMSVKLSRITWMPAKRDNWVDLAGYAACGYECAVEEAEV